MKRGDVWINYQYLTDAHRKNDEKAKKNNTFVVVKFLRMLYNNWVIGIRNHHREI